MSLKVGSTLGAYAIESEIGRGGMGVVFLARDTRLDRRVAIKSLPEELLLDAERLARFEREAKILASLTHPGIAGVYALEEVDGGKYLVMEYLEGETLEDRLRRGRLPIEEALPIARQIAESIEAAHEKGIIHRDLKPGNVMLTPDGTIKVLDFGLAREAAKRPPQTRVANVGTPPVARTEEGLVLGTLGYMSPEQARGLLIDQRTDVFAFGCLLFECLTGRAAFGGDSPADIILATLDREPDWSLLPERTPARVRELLEKCLAKDPKYRWRAIADARLDLERAIERREWRTSGPMPAANMPQRRLGSSLPWFVAGVALLAAATIGWLWSRSVSAASAAHRSLPVRFTLNDPQVPHRHKFDAGTIAISPDGSTVVYRGASPKGGCFYVRRLSDSTLSALTFDVADDAANPVFSPDGRWVAFSRTNQILKIPIEGGQLVPLHTGDQMTKGLCWTTRGIILTPTISSGLFLLAPEGGALTPLTKPDSTRGEVSHRWPDALPDGRHVLFTVKKADITTFDDAEIALLDMETGQWRTIIKGGTYARWSPTGHIVYAREGKLLAVPFDVASGELRGAPIAMVQGVVTESGSGAAEFAIARESGTLVYVPGEGSKSQSEVIWIDRDGKVTPAGAPLRNYSGLAISPDGMRFSTWVLGATDTVFVHDLARGISTRLTFQGNSDKAFWSLDGKRIAFTSDRDGAQATFVANADGTGATERLLDEPVDYGSSFVRFEGKECLLYPKGNDVMIKPPNDPARALFHAPVPPKYPRVSPDGHWIAYTSNESGTFEIFVRPFPAGEGRWQVSYDIAGGGWWLPDSDGVVFCGADNVMHVARRGANGFDSVRIESLFKMPDNLFAVNMLPDGSRFLAMKIQPDPPESGKVEAVLNWFEELQTKAVAEPR